LLKSPEKILVYKTIPPIVTKETTLALAKKFNVTGTLRGETVVQSEDLVYDVFIRKNSGTASYSNAKRPNNAMDAPDKLPSDEEAAKIATQFLKEKDLLPEGAFFSRIEREYARGIDKDGKEIRYNGRIVVWFGRKLNGLDVKGTQLSIEIGGNGDVIGYYANWRDYSPFKEYPLKSPETAIEDLQKQGIAVGVEKPDTISITNFNLAYRTTPGAYAEEYLEPVWVFSGEAFINGKSVMPVQAYIPALKEVPAELTGEPKISPSIPTTPVTANITATPIVPNVTEILPTTVFPVNETVTPTVTVSPTGGNLSAGNGFNETITLPVPTDTVISNTTV
jgi:hypothetical protein